MLLIAGGGVWLVLSERRNARARAQVPEGPID
jgi:hypothetical protein